MFPSKINKYFCQIPHLLSDCRVVAAVQIARLYCGGGPAEQAGLALNKGHSYGRRLSFLLEKYAKLFVIGPPAPSCSQRDSTSVIATKFPSPANTTLLLPQKERKGIPFAPFPPPFEDIIEVAAAGNVLNFDRRILVGRREKENVAREKEHHVLYKSDFSNALFLQEAKMKDFDWHF